MSMEQSLEVPDRDDLSELPVEVLATDEPWVSSVVAEAEDGATVTVTWDAIARSVHVQWRSRDEDQLVLERETATRVSVHRINGDVEFRVLSEALETKGELVIRIGRIVTVHDALLRK
jgi:hypothetical protein